jgi:uncharacterized DUF497 family protein
VKIEWDQAKNRANIRKYGLDFRHAEQIFRGALLAEPDMRDDYEKSVGEGLV